MVKRLQAVKEYLELTYDNENELQDLVFLAAEICKTPISSITFIDDVKQYPVVGQGTVVESSCEIAFCNQTIQQSSLLEVTDASTDSRFSNNPLVTGNPHIRFYAGMPLVTAQGLTIGTLCVIGQKPQKLSEEQKKSLQILSKQVMQRLETKRNIQLLKYSIEEATRNQQLIEQAEVMKKAFYDNSNDYFLLINSSYEIVAFNAATEQLCARYGRSIAKGDKLLDYVSPASVDKFKYLLSKASAGESVYFEYLMNEAQDDESWCKIFFNPTYNSLNELIGISCIGCNLDKDKELQNTINQQKTTLAQIAKLHSHEIRHPLTNIMGLVSLIKQESFRFNEQYISYLDQASQELDSVIKKIVLNSYEAV